MILLDAVEVSMSRPDRPLFTDVSVTVSSGDHLGIVGINGTGKSTLLRVLTGQNEPESGTVRFGRDVQVVMLDQAASLPGGSVLDAVLGELVRADDGAERRWEAEKVLSHLGMGGHLQRGTGELSGGEAKRVALARALVQPSDLLVLDEPTNHLDLEGIEALAGALKKYEGTVIFVSHDRWFVEQLATRILEIRHEGVDLFDGTYSEFVQRTEADHLDRLAVVEAAKRDKKSKKKKKKK